MKTRLISSIIYAVVLFLGTNNFGSALINNILSVSITQNSLYLGLIILLYFLVMAESCKMMDYDNWLFIFLTFLVGLIPLYIFGKQFYYSNVTLFFNLKYMLMIVLTIIAVITTFRFPDEITVNDNSKLIFNVVHIGLPFGIALTIPNTVNGFGNEVFYVFILIWLSDSFAYLVGSKFGTKKLFPTISPNKSKEGFIGGIIATIIGGIIIEFSLPELRGNFVIIALIISIIAPLGDLQVSKIKRIFQVKDTGNLIPGHGGILDRLDSFLLCVPFIFLYYILIN